MSSKATEPTSGDLVMVTRAERAIRLSFFGILAVTDGQRFLIAEARDGIVALQLPDAPWLSIAKVDTG